MQSTSRLFKMTGFIALTALLSACGGGGGGGSNNTNTNSKKPVDSIVIQLAANDAATLILTLTSPSGARHSNGGAKPIDEICFDRTDLEDATHRLIECAEDDLEPGIYEVTVSNTGTGFSTYHVYVQQGTNKQQIANNVAADPKLVSGPHTFKVGDALDLGGEITGSKGADPSAKIADIAGTWSFDEEVTAATGPCSAIGDTKTSTITISTDGSNGSITIITDEGVFSGTLMGNELSWTGSFATNGGTASFGVVSLVFAANGSSMSGSIDATWTDGSTNCAVTFSEIGTRTSLLAAPIADITGDWSVTYTNTTKSCGAAGGGATYPATITMTGNDVDMTWNGNDYTGTINGAQLSFIKDFSGGVSGGGVTVDINVTVSSDGLSFSGTQDWVSASPVCSGTDSLTGVTIK